MFDKKINTRIVNKHAREADWLTSTLIPLCGELIIYDKEVDSDGNVIKPERLKIGDGVSNVNDLNFVSSQAGSGSGDMEKSVYDTDGDGVVDNAERLGGVDASAYVKTEELGSLATKSTVDKDDLSEDIQQSLNKADTAIQSIDGLATEDYVDNKVDSLGSLAGKSIVEKTDLSTDIQASLNKADSAVQSVEGLATEDYVDNLIESLGDLAAKSTVEKSDLSADVQASLNKANTALQSFTETDPTVPEWAKADTKPSYTAGEVGAVPTSRTVNGKALSSNITLSASDVGAIPDTIPIPDSLADLTSDATHRTVTDTEKATWNAKATTTYVDQKVAGIVDSSPEALNTLNELAAALGDDPNFATTVATEIGKKVDKVSGKGLSTNDYTTAEKNKLAGISSGAEVNQNAFSNVKVGDTTIAADGKTDTLTFAGSNVTITPDATNDKITFSVADGSTSAKGVVQLTNSTSSTSTTTAATPKSVKDAYDLANTAKTNAATAQAAADAKLPLSGGNISGHVYLTGAVETSSTSNSSQIVFGTSSNNHVVISSNKNALVINPTTSTTDNQIILYLDKPAVFRNGIQGNASSATTAASCTGNAATATTLSCFTTTVDGDTITFS